MKNIYRFVSVLSMLYVTHAAAVAQPEGYLRVQQKVNLNDKHLSKKCDAPSPYRGDLVFRSRYEGSGKARDQVNLKATQAYENQSQSITDFQKFVAKKVDLIVARGRGKATMNCLLSNLDDWAENSDLLRPTDNHTGKAVRKWTLASVSSSLLKIDQLASDYDSKKYTKVKTWVGQMADQVVIDYSDRPLKKINNHDYWAAWGVITTAALLNREDLYVWSRNVFNTAMGQVDSEGFLANELRRASRAAMYHNYAVTPLVGIAAFLKVNGDDPASYHEDALDRLVNTVVVGVTNPKVFRQKTGVSQIDYDYLKNGRMSWLAIYPDVSPNTSNADLVMLKKNAKPLASTRMGGDLTIIY
ncbi:alginate lyase family protein [Echinimonas agarilytica]|uniref:Alginate lyase family protein n=1 Tax=Echinimonas agarilytica TaxID=1215918 RepID=A0AA42B8P7_9GAMM|nr:alginate lyase family protein [Echinimonas agarilytica]MCM2681219.1 alginate lyase family protein [Echinimonas agarilytica]